MICGSPAAHRNTRRRLMSPWGLFRRQAGAHECLTRITLETLRRCLLIALLHLVLLRHLWMRCQALLHEGTARLTLAFAGEPFGIGLGVALLHLVLLRGLRTHPGGTQTPQQRHGECNPGSTIHRLTSACDVLALSYPN